MRHGNCSASPSRVTARTAARKRAGLVRQRPYEGERNESIHERPRRRGHRRQQGDRHRGGAALCRVRRQGRDPRARRAGFEDRARRTRQRRPRCQRLRLRCLQGRGYLEGPRQDRRGSRQDRRARQQCRHGAHDGVRGHQRRSLAGRSRSQAVRGDPLQPAGLAGHEGAQMGPHHQRAQYLRQGAGGLLRADLGFAGGRHGADQGDGERRRRAQHPRQRDAGRPDHERSMGQAARRAGAGHGLSRSSPKISPRGLRSAASERRRSSRTSPASLLPSRAHSSPAPPSMSMAAARRWSESTLVFN